MDSYMADGTYIIVTPVGQDDWQAVVYSHSFRRIDEYWLVNPDGLENSGWLLVKRVDGENRILRANPFSPVLGCRHLKAIYVEL
jgi:hypothetical protein